MRLRSNDQSLLWGALLVATLLVVYLATLLPGVGASGDTAKFQYAGRVLGIVHPTGYPTYLLLNHTFTKLWPFGSIAYRANLLSAMCAASTCLFLYLTLLELGVRPVLAGLVGLVHGLTKNFWSHAIVAEVYTLNTLFTALVLFLLIRWHQRNQLQALLAALFFFAISLGNHLLMLTVAPAFAVVVVSHQRSVLRRRTLLLAAGLFFLLGICQYLYLFWRTADPSNVYVEAEILNLTSFWSYVSGRQYEALMFPFSLGEIVTLRLPYYSKLLAEEYAVALPLAFYGLVSLPSGVRRGAGLILLANLIIVVNYGIVDIAVYILPASLVLGLGLGVGLERWATALAGRWRRCRIAILLLMPLGFFAFNLHCSRRGEVADAQRAIDLLEVLGDHAVLVDPGYSLSHFLFYELLVGDYRDKNIAIYKSPTLDGVAEYLRREKPILIRYQRQFVAPGRDVYAFGQVWADQLRQLGFHAHPLEQEVYLITVGARPTPAQQAKHELGEPLWPPVGITP